MITIIKKLKAIGLLLLLFTFTTNIVAQSWNLVGLENFSGGTITFNDIKVDNNNIPYVVYRDFSNSGKTTVKKFNGTNWVLVGNAGFGGTGGSDTDQLLVFDNNNTPYVSIREGNYPSEQISVLKFNGTNWVYVGNQKFTPVRSGYSSIAIDNNNVPYVSYSDGTGNSFHITVKKFNGTSWESVGNIGTKGFFSKIKFDSSNTPFLAYRDDTQSSKVTVRKFTSGSWNLVGSAGFSDGSINLLQLEITDNNTIFIAFQDGSASSRLTVMKFNGTNWENVGIKGFSNGGSIQEMDLTSTNDNQPIVIYSHPQNSFKTYVKQFDKTSWEELGNVNLNSSSNNIVITSNSKLYISYRKSGKLSVKSFQLLKLAHTNTNSASSIAITSAEVGGNITSNNGFNITERGIVYSSSNNNPKIGESGVTKFNEGNTGIGQFTSTINNLTKYTTYYYKAYATNSEGTSYGEVKSFTTLNDIPTVTTTTATTITTTTATLGGEVTIQGKSSILEKGIVYSITDETPQINESEVIKDVNGTGIGVFSKITTNLNPNTKYYYRAFATNSNGTAYGEIKNFTTLKAEPTVTTTIATSVTITSAKLGGEITNQGLSSITERGVIYSTTDTNPKIGDTNVTKDENRTGTGTFSENITGLTANTTYFFRAYAINTHGTSYGEVKSFKLNNALNFDGTDDRVTIADNAAFDFSSGFTAEAWINPDVLGTQTYLSQYASSQEAFAFILLSSGKIEFTVTTDGNTDQYFESTTSITAGSWSHIALTFDGSTMRAYINGVAAGTKSVSGTMFNSTAPIEIGARNNAHFFNGNIDEVRIWSKVLTVAEISAQKDKSIPSNTPSLVAYYKLNQGIAEGNNTVITTLTDSGPNNLNGTLNNFANNGSSSNFVAGVSGTFENGVLATNTFATTGNWSTASNWSLGVVPTQVDQVTIASGQTVTIDVDDLTIDDFTLENTAILNIPKGKEITIQNSFTSNGTLELGSDKNDSGVLLIEGTSTGNVTYKRGGLLANKWSTVTPPVSGQTVKTFAENTANNIRINTTPNPDRYAIAYYDDAQITGSKWKYFDANVSASTEFVAGQSYIMSRATDGEVSFTGTLTVGNLVKTLIADKWNAIGNPFTAYYPANKNTSNSFLNDNMNALDDAYKSLYIWDNTQAKYVAITEVDATARSLPPGQGFFVRMKAGQTEINFKATKRSTKPSSGTTVFAKSANPEITLILSSNKTSVKTQIKYFRNTTLGLDPGYDIGNFNGASLDIFTRLLENGKNVNYTIQSLPNTNYQNMIVPIGVKGSKGQEITFTAKALNLPNELDVYLEDREKNIFSKINSIEKYSITLENNTNNIGRFYLHTSSKTLSNDNVSQLSRVSMYTINRTLKINNLENKTAQLTIHSLLGKEVFNTKIVSKNTTEVHLPKLSKGVYIIRLKTENEELNKKIILQ